MLRIRVAGHTTSRKELHTTNGNHASDESSKGARHLFVFKRTKRLLPLLLVLICLGCLVGAYFSPSSTSMMGGTLTRSIPSVPSGRKLKPSMQAFDAMIKRSNYFEAHCKSLNLLDHSIVDTSKNNHTAHLPPFGLLKAAKDYERNPPDYPYTCELPPENECSETQFTVIFMAYNPDRLQKLYNQILKMLQQDTEFLALVKEVVVVWNGERVVEETQMGKALVDLTKTLPLRISYPLKAGFPNDLMNRYHPRLEIKTKAIMYYDDDGPFYSYKATLGGFELWKRNSNAQIGAMARKLDLDERQTKEKQEQLQSRRAKEDRFFVSHCPTDELKYNYFEFANFGANMVLPSGSFLHSNYLCFLWHPIFEEIRQFVKDHPVHPDDGTVSAIVSHLSGRAPKVYSRRINESKDPPHGRRLMRLHEHQDAIDWDNPGNHDTKMMWGRLRSDVANSLIRYFGSINSGSLGWCHNTPWQQGQQCKPEMAKIGYLPWLNDDHTAKYECPE